MHEVCIENKEVSVVLKIVDELRQYDIISGKDFYFYYHPVNKFNKIRYTVFKFVNIEHATFFTLKWC